jgi:nucleotide-binding universal stress UspA family protein
MIKHPLYLVPFDFTEVSNSALRLALDLSEANDGGVFLLHVVKKDKEKIKAKNEFAQVLSGLTEDERARTLTNVIEGDLFTDVGKAGDILHASLIVMGTHGAKGFQKLFGSHAQRLITSASTPVLITQGKKSVDRIKTIVMPFNFTRESIRIVKFAGSIAKKFNASIHLVGFHESDSGYEEKMKMNQSVAQNYFEENNITHTIANLPGGNEYLKQLMAYAKGVQADLFAAAFVQDGILPAPNTFMQAIIENEDDIPVLTINSEGLGGQFYY